MFSLLPLVVTIDMIFVAFFQLTDDMTCFFLPILHSILSHFRTQNFAQQMQQENPELVEQLRNQFRGTDPDNSKPDE